MKERPILFSAPMVRALLAGTKTQTRRMCKGQRELSNVHDFQLDRCPYGAPGDQLWVREAWQFNPVSGLPPVVYRADETATRTGGMGWLPSIFMPRAASRIALEVTGVRVERLQDISRGDAMEEGCPFPNMAKGPDPRKWYADLWEQINGAGSWEANQWVWCVSFRRVA